MDWLTEVKEKQKKGRSVLFGKNSEYLQDLEMLLDGQDHRTLILWALDLGKSDAELLRKKYPKEQRPELALTAARDWAAGNVKMPYAQRKILDCHALAKEITSKEDIALCHAVGQACAVVHTAGHAMGFPIYDLTAVVCRYGIDQCRPFVGERKRYYMDRLFYWMEQGKDDGRPWAGFLMK